MRGIFAGDAWRDSPGHDGRLHQESLQATSPGKDSVRHVTKYLCFLYPAAISNARKFDIVFPVKPDV
jgi:hypothetical protein